MQLNKVYGITLHSFDKRVGGGLYSFITDEYCKKLEKEKIEFTEDILSPHEILVKADKDINVLFTNGVVQLQDREMFIISITVNYANQIENLRKRISPIVEKCDLLDAEDKMILAS